MAKKGEGKGKTKTMAKPARASPEAKVSPMSDEIPAFLRRRKDNTVDARLRPPKSAKTSAAPREPTVMEQAAAVLAELPAEDRKYFEDQIENKVFMHHWLLDPSTVRMALLVRQEKQIKKEESLARLRALGEAKKATEPPKVKRPAFGSGVKFKVLKEAPRKEGTRGAKVYAAMVAWKKKNPSGTVAELLAMEKETGYNKTDLAWDVDHGHIKTDV